MHFVTFVVTFLKPMISLLRLFRFLKNSWQKLVVSFILLIIATALALSQPRLIEYAIDSGIHEGKFAAIALGAAIILLTALLAAGVPQMRILRPIPGLAWVPFWLVPVGDARGVSRYERVNALQIGQGK